MNIFQLSCFLTVSETLNFARAAEHLNITQPAVTHQIRSLESELGAKLFLRTTHSVELTHAGLLFIDDARNIVTTAHQAQRRFEHMQEYKFSAFHIGCHIDGYPAMLPEALHEFAAAFPDIHPQIHMSTSPAFLFRLLEEEQADLILSIKDPSSRHPGIYKELINSPVVCVCSADHPLAGHVQVTKTDLDKEHLILFDTTKSSFFSATFQGQMSAGRLPEELYFCESTPVAILLAKAGYGVFFLPECLVPEDDDLVTIPLENAGYESFGVYYRTLQKNQPLRQFIEFLKKYI